MAASKDPRQVAARKLLNEALEHTDEMPVWERTLLEDWECALCIGDLPPGERPTYNGRKYLSPKEIGLLTSIHSRRVPAKDRDEG